LRKIVRLTIFDRVSWLPCRLMSASLQVRLKRCIAAK
jgi:hypothetical protein